MSLDRNVLVLRSKASILSYQIMNDGLTTPVNIFSNLTSISHAHATLPLLFDNNGLLFANTLTNPHHVTIQSTSNGNILANIPVHEIQAAEFSPLGTFMVSLYLTITRYFCIYDHVSLYMQVTFARPVKGSATDAGEGNLRIWRVSDGSVQGSYHQKVAKKDLIQWDKSESVCMRIVTNELHVFNGVSPSSGIIGKLHHKGLTQFKLAPICPIAAACVVVFNPEAGGKPARASIHKLTRIGDTELSEAINARTMFAANEADIYWNSKGYSYSLTIHAYAYYC
jgi:uncharacterized protein with WD repeat